MLNSNFSAFAVANLPTNQALSALYGSETANLQFQLERYRGLLAGFQEYFPGPRDLSCFSSPGRTEIIGNHTDHQNGKVLCAAVKMDIIAAAAKNNDMLIRLKSKGYEKIDVIDLRELDPQPEEREHSAALLRGIAARFKQLGLEIGGFDAYTESSVRQGSGLSSSAAFEILVATIMDHLYNNNKLNGLERAQISQYSENVYFGKPSGLMDQCACSIGGFIFIDFFDKQNPRVEQLNVDFESAAYDLVITHPGGNHADLTDAYAAIPTEMKAVAEALGKTVLSEISAEDFYRALPRLHESLSDRALLRAVHFYNEQARVDRAFTYLKEENFPAFFDELKASGQSSWMYLQNVTAFSADTEQSLALALAISERYLAGQGATRVHGGGFAGTIQAFVPSALTEGYLRAMNEVFGTDAATKVGLRPYGGIALDLLG